MPAMNGIEQNWLLAGSHPWIYCVRIVASQSGRLSSCRTFTAGGIIDDDDDDVINLRERFRLNTQQHNTQPAIKHRLGSIGVT